MRVIILGAGLTGLTTAYLLREENVDITILEARGRIGGRIWTLSVDGDTPVEAGATWFGMKHEYLVRLLDELHVGYFPQFREGIGLYDANPPAPPQAFKVPDDEPVSYRVQGGTHHLIEALQKKLAPSIIQTDNPVESLDFTSDICKVRTRAGNEFEADLVISTLPPQIFAYTIETRPSLPEPWTLLAQQTHTWMSDSIKFFASYPRRFWTEQSYSGMAFGPIGLITEMYDHTHQGASLFTLKGFLSNQAYKAPPYGLKNDVIEKIATYFGPQVPAPSEYGEIHWENEQFTSVPNLESFLLPHQNNGHEALRASFFENRLIIGGSETADQFPGYMDGAVNSAYRIAHRIKSF